MTTTTFKPYEANIEALGYTPEKKRDTLFKLRSDLLNKLIDQKLADQQIKKNNIKVSEVRWTEEKAKAILDEWQRKFTDVSMNIFLTRPVCNALMDESRVFFFMLELLS